MLGELKICEKTRVIKIGGSFGIRIPACLHNAFPFSKEDKISLQMLDAGVRIKKFEETDGVNWHETSIMKAGAIYFIRIPSELLLIVNLNDRLIMRIKDKEVFVENV